MAVAAQGLAFIAKGCKPLLRLRAPARFGYAHAMHLPDQYDTLSDEGIAQARRAHPADLALHNHIERKRPALAFKRWMRVDCEIDPRDEIYRFFADHPTSLNPPRDYLADGWRSLSELMVLLERLNKPLTQLASMLEFASGYGRFTRHLAPLLPGRLWVSEVMPGAVEFAQQRFGVEGFPSTLDPREIQWPRTFELVFVLSLFTHLQPARWTAWLQALYAATAPGGLLIFSVHSEESELPSGLSFDSSGALFSGNSESTHLHESDYGMTWTTREFIRLCCLNALNLEPTLHTQTCFWVGQDAVVIAKPEAQ